MFPYIRQAFVALLKVVVDSSFSIINMNVILVQVKIFLSANPSPPPPRLAPPECLSSCDPNVFLKYTSVLVHVFEMVLRLLLVSCGRIPLL